MREAQFNAETITLAGIPETRTKVMLNLAHQVNKAKPR
jgi:hypothetical protein